MTKATICALAWERHVGLEQNSSEAEARAVLNNLGFGRIAKDPTPFLGCSSNECVVAQTTQPLGQSTRPSGCSKVSGPM